MKNEVALMCHDFPTKSQWSPLKKILLSFEKPILNPKVRFIKGYSGPQVYGPKPSCKPTQKVLNSLVHDYVLSPYEPWVTLHICILSLSKA